MSEISRDEAIRRLEELSLMVTSPDNKFALDVAIAALRQQGEQSRPVAVTREQAGVARSLGFVEGVHFEVTK